MRTSGILMHISSLPSPYGIGTFGREATRFVDFLKRAKQSYWQILPLGCTSYGDSPYQSFSTFAGNPYFIDLDTLHAEGLLKPSEYRGLPWGVDPLRVDYAALYNHRFAVLKSAYARFDADNADFRYFCEREASWLNDFALFMALKKRHGDRSWHEWEDRYRFRDKQALSEFEAGQSAETGFWRFLQYKFFEQWDRLKRYANENGIEIIGDLPIYVADDSADVWSNPALFDLDENLNPRFVAGVPPDAFTATGQLWGNPVYNWGEMRAQNYRWWIERLRMASTQCDVVRLDHFRGFESFYIVPYGSTDAVNGVWRVGPGIELFDALRAALGDVRVIAETLGFLTPAARQLHECTGYPGMNVLQFAFGADDFQNENLPHNIPQNSVTYAGTHDNPTILGWSKTVSRRDLDYCRDYINCGRGDDLTERMLRATLASPSDLAVTTIQDWLGLGERGRMNTPSTLYGNWQWRAGKADLTAALAERIAHRTKLYGRADHR